MIRTLFPALLLPLLLCAGAACAADEPQPYAANLFQGNFSQSAASGDKNAAVIAPGDRVVLRLWGGGLKVDDTLVVSPDGRLDVPEVGVIPVAGLGYDTLTEALRSKLAAGGRTDTQIYAAPLDARPVTVFVTGGVARPGRYAGAPGDTLLHFLDKAGGIDGRRGSYRDIRLMRAGRKVAELDLYPFARRGEQPQVRVQEGDTLVVGDKGATVTATGAVRTSARFEFPRGRATGAALAELAEPQARASHIALSGTRNGEPYSTYLPLRELRNLKLEDGDQVQFIADAPGNTMMIEVQGAVRGTSRFPVRRGARLQEVKNFIAVEPERAELQSMYIKRRSVAARQKKAIADSLRRLEESAMTASSGSTDEASIRAKEAEMISKFVERAKAVEPEGVVVLDGGPDKADLALEDGDVIVIPAKSDVVLVSGEVMSPQAMLWSRKKDADDYIAGAGGFTNRADRSRTLILHQNGAVTQDAGDIRPGDQIMVLPRVESKSMQSIKDISQVIMQVVVSARLLLGMPSL
ncbi:polysaccharide biosynthesis/export family protein [uncultured Desulfovibrio sp.]|uniref:polysaccharide biosynthesis/export family protein n=1 Tax=uncultured Desulfovibrio sp. TaxID=167968 RepID=UPI002602E0DB|nr:polysaccharide biosynthesis/export family protein [uncultured Desulfovibrio sp.]